MRPRGRANWAEITGSPYVDVDNDGMDLSRGGLGQFDRSADLTGVTSLDLSHNQLIALPAWVGEVRSLVSLNLSHNDLTELPSWIGDLTQLEALDLSHNQLTELPPTFANLAVLTSLQLDNNRFPRVPDHLPATMAVYDLNEGRSGW
jgi:Leucine-rich repeat (LRR) protein